MTKAERGESLQCTLYLMTYLLNSVCVCGGGGGNYVARGKSALLTRSEKSPSPENYAISSKSNEAHRHTYTPHTDTRIRE
jgi:hypothetical protein